jgi:hypothetical protein
MYSLGVVLLLCFVPSCIDAVERTGLARIPVRRALRSDDVNEKLKAEHADLPDLLHMLTDEDPSTRGTMVALLELEFCQSLSAPPALPACAQLALERVEAQAQAASEAAVPDLLRHFRRSDRSRTMDDVRHTLDFFANGADLNVNMDPFKDIDGTPLLQLFSEDVDGRYRTQFETGTSGGSENLRLRRGWERRMFGDAYDGHDVHRPKYGNVNFLARTAGDEHAHQYGKSYLVLGRQIRARCTITSADSSSDGCKLGTLRHCAHVLLDFISNTPRAHRADFVEVLYQLGRRTDDGALATIAQRIRRGDLTANPFWQYMEVQVHGPLRFERDVTLVVVSEQEGAAAALTPREQAQLWVQFAERYGVQAYRMASGGMVAVS